MHKTVAVIGHVDHGKTALVKALTGTNTDRLEEERKRGLSIVLGFASQPFSEGLLHFIDTPGHSDFIQTAAMGLSGADAVLLVVDSIEGPSHQTVEHLKLAQLFGIRDVVVALSKTDLDRHSSNGNLADEITELLREYGVATPSIIACSSQTMEGIDDLTSALHGLLNSKRPHQSPERAFLPIDRVFSAEGVGTVVTGTLLGSSLSVDDEVIAQPTETTCSVRGLQIAGRPAENATPGARVAVNVRGIKSQNIRKGDVLCASSLVKPARLFDVVLHAPTGGVRAIAHMEAVTVLYGTQHSPARVRVLAKDNQDAIIGQLEFETDQIGYSGQRFVIRRPASFETVCGGYILDAQATLAKRKKKQHVSVLQAADKEDIIQIAKAIAERDNGSVALPLLSRLGRRNVDECILAIAPEFIMGANEIAYSVEQIQTVKAQLIETLKAFHQDRPLRPHAPLPSTNVTFNQTPKGLLHHAIQSLIDENEIEARLDGIAIVGHDPIENLRSTQREIYDGALEQLRRTCLMPDLLLDSNSSDPEHCDLLDLMVWKGAAVRLYNHALNQTVILHSDAIEGAIASLQRAFPAEQVFKTGEARAALSTNRKTIVPLLEHLDVRGITRRDGNFRVIKPAQSTD